MTDDGSHEQVRGEDQHCTEKEEEAADVGSPTARNLTEYNFA